MLFIWINTEGYIKYWKNYKYNFFALVLVGKMLSALEARTVKRGSTNEW